jgi:hypothetical protein
MKSPQIFDFYIWNPLKKGVYMTLMLKIKRNNQCYFCIAIGFCQLIIDFEVIYYRLKK